jgi:voltage-gated potassium channel
MDPRLKRNLLFFGIVLLSLALLNYFLLLAESAHAESDIQSYSDTVWYMIVTLTSVGYGDLVPVTTLGRVVGYVYILASLVILGVLISSIASNIMNMIEERKLGFMGTHFENHIVCIGWNDFSRMVVDEVIQAERQVAIVTQNRDEVDLIYDQYGKKDVFVLFTDYHNYESIGKTNPNAASEVFLGFQDDTESLIYIINFKKMYSNPNMVVAIRNHKLRETFIAAGAKHVVARNEIASKLVASYVFEPEVATLNIDLMSSAVSDDDFDNQQYIILNENPYCNTSYLDTFHDMKDKYNVVLLGISKKQTDSYQLLINPGGDIMVEEGDYLIMMVSGKTKQTIEAAFNVKEGKIN